MEYILCPYMFSPYTEKQRQVFWGYNAGAHLWLIEKFWRQLITKGDLSRSFAVVLSLSKWLLKRQIQLKWISSVPEDNVSLVIMPHFLSVLLLTIEPRFLLTQARQAFHHWTWAWPHVLSLNVLLKGLISNCLLPFPTSQHWGNPMNHHIASAFLISPLFPLLALDFSL